MDGGKNALCQYWFGLISIATSFRIDGKLFQSESDKLPAAMLNWAIQTCAAFSEITKFSFRLAKKLFYDKRILNVSRASIPSRWRRINSHFSTVSFKEINYDSPRGGVSVITEKGDVTTSYLLIQRARSSDSGQYTCRPSNANPKTVQVHILKGS